jgi:hypothetical protein
MSTEDRESLFTDEDYKSLQWLWREVMCEGTPYYCNCGCGMLCNSNVSAYSRFLCNAWSDHDNVKCEQCVLEMLRLNEDLEHVTITARMIVERSVHEYKSISDSVRDLKRGEKWW